MKVKLGDVCNIQSGGTPSRSKEAYWKEGNIHWVKISDMKDQYIYDTEECITTLGVQNSSAKIFPKDTILYSIFATIGEVSILKIEAATNQAIAGIQIIDNRIYANYLYYYLLSMKFKMNNIGRGVAQNNINIGILKNIEIRVRNLDEQKRIVMMLDKVNELITKRHKQLEKLDELVKARFVEMFGDPVSNSLNLPVSSLAQLGELGRGVSKHRPRNAPELLGGKYPLIQTSEVANSNLYISTYNNTYSELGLQQSKLWKVGTLCITIAANIAKTAILSIDACFPDSVVGFIPNNKCNNVFIHYWFSFFQQILEAQAPESAQKNINLKILSELKVIVPSIEAQKQFSVFAEQAEKTKNNIQYSIDKLEKLKKSLMQKYFD